MATSTLRIAIVGAGPTGLTLGALLHQSGIPFTIYELRSKPTEEQLDEPSGMLDLHPDSGLAAVRACGLFKQVMSYTGDCEESTIIVDKDGTVLYKEDPPLDIGPEAEDAHRPEIARNNLARALYTMIPPESIKWNSKLVSATRDAEQEEVTLYFNNADPQTFDLVIGADGAWSKVRPLVSSAATELTSLHNISLGIRDVTRRYPELAELTGRGMFLAFGSGSGIVCHRSTHDTAWLYLYLNSQSEETIKWMSTASHAQVKERLVSDDTLFGTWGPTTKHLIEVAIDDDAEARGGKPLKPKPLARLPIGIQWDHVPGVILIGDAAHLMTPFAGEGVNIAMADSLSFARAIIKAYQSSHGEASRFKADLVPTAKECEQDMFARGKGAAARSDRNREISFGNDGAEGVKGIFLRMAAMFANGPPGKK